MHFFRRFSWHLLVFLFVLRTFYLFFIGGFTEIGGFLPLLVVFLLCAFVRPAQYTQCTTFPVLPSVNPNFPSSLLDERKTQNAKRKTIVSPKATYLNHLRSKYLRFALCTLHFALCVFGSCPLNRHLPPGWENFRRISPPSAGSVNPSISPSAQVANLHATIIPHPPEKATHEIPNFPTNFNSVRRGDYQSPAQLFARK